MHRETPQGHGHTGYCAGWVHECREINPAQCLAQTGFPGEDKLFATLDPMTRRVKLPGGQEFLLTDTVGFIQRLPTTLVAASGLRWKRWPRPDLLVACRR